MAAQVRLATATANAMIDAAIARIDAGSGAGTVKLYGGTIPTNADTAIGSQTLLAELTLSDPSAPSAASRSVTFNAVTQDSSANATATATWGRIADSAGNTVMDGTCGVTGSGSFIELNTTAIVSGGPVQITSITLNFPSP